MGGGQRHSNMFHCLIFSPPPSVPHPTQRSLNHLKFFSFFLFGFVKHNTILTRPSPVLLFLCSPTTANNRNEQRHQQHIQQPQKEQTTNPTATTPSNHKQHLLPGWRASRRQAAREAVVHHGEALDV